MCIIHFDILQIDTQAVVVIYIPSDRCKSPATFHIRLSF